MTEGNQKLARKRGLNEEEWKRIWQLANDLQPTSTDQIGILIKMREVINGACVRNYDRGTNTAYVFKRRKTMRERKARYIEKLRKKLADAERAEAEAAEIGEEINESVARVDAATRIGTSAWQADAGGSFGEPTPVSDDGDCGDHARDRAALAGRDDDHAAAAEGAGGASWPDADGCDVRSDADAGDGGTTGPEV